MGLGTGLSASLIIHGCHCNRRPLHHLLVGQRWYASGHPCRCRSGEVLSGDLGSGEVRVSGSWSKKRPPPFRPKAIALMHSGERPGKATSPRQVQDPVVPMRGVEASKLEGSATSDENNQPRQACPLNLASPSGGVDGLVSKDHSRAVQAGTKEGSRARPEERGRRQDR